MTPPQQEIKTAVLLAKFENGVWWIDDANGEPVAKLYSDEWTARNLVDRLNNYARLEQENREQDGAICMLKKASEVQYLLHQETIKKNQRLREAIRYAMSFVFHSHPTVYEKLGQALATDHK